VRVDLSEKSSNHRLLARSLVRCPKILLNGRHPSRVHLAFVQEGTNQIERFPSPIIQFKCWIMRVWHHFRVPIGSVPFGFRESKGIRARTFFVEPRPICVDVYPLSFLFLSSRFRQHQHRIVAWTLCFARFASCCEGTAGTDETCLFGGGHPFVSFFSVFGTRASRWRRAASYGDH